MSTYDEIYSTLLKLCQKEGLRLVEAELSNNGILIWFQGDSIILNTANKNNIAQVELFDNM